MQTLKEAITSSLTPLMTSLRLSALTPAAQPKPPACPLCNDLGFVSVAGPGGIGSRLVECDCKLPERFARMQAICGLTGPELNASLDDIDAQPRSDTGRMLTEARRFIDHPVGMLTIYGSCGNAKTVVEQAIVNACIKRNRGAIYTTFYDLVGYVREAFRPEAPDSAWARMRRLQDVPVLCIDEFDKVRHTEWVQEVETQLIDTRYRRSVAGECGTVLAMNEDIEILLRDKPHLLSRLKDGRNVIVRNMDRDMRGLMR